MKCHANAGGTCSGWLKGLIVLLALACPAYVLANTTNTIPTVFSFENYAGGTELVDMDGNGVDGWYGSASTGAVARVVETNYVYAKSVGFPLPGATRTKILRVSGSVSNVFQSPEVTWDPNPPIGTGMPLTGLTNVWIDCMMQAGRLDREPTVDNVQVAMYFNSNGHLVVRHAFYTNNFSEMVQTWSELDHPVVQSDEWVRVTICMDYLSSSTNPIYGSLSQYEHYFRVQLDGNGYMSHSRAYTNATPIDESSMGGTYFLCADSGGGSHVGGVNHAYFSSLALEGVGMLDDVVVTNKPVLVTQTTIAPQWWLDLYDLTSDSNDDDNDGAKTWEEYIAGTVPTDSSSVFQVIEQGQIDGSNFVRWVGTTNSGVYTKFVMYRASVVTTNKSPEWVQVATGLDRSANGTNYWIDGTHPTEGVPAFYMPAVPMP